MLALDKENQLKTVTATRRLAKILIFTDFSPCIQSYLQTKPSSLYHILKFISISSTKNTHPSNIFSHLSEYNDRGYIFEVIV